MWIISPFSRIINAEGLKRPCFISLHGGHGGWQRILVIWLLRGTPSCTLSRASAEAERPFGGLRFGKCICRAEPTLDLDDGLALPAQKPSQFDSESVGSFCSYGADAMFKGPLAI